MTNQKSRRAIPFFGARKFAQSLLNEIATLEARSLDLAGQIERLGVLSVVQLEEKRVSLQRDIEALEARRERDRLESVEAIRLASAQLDEARKAIVVTEDLALLQEVGIYRYRHPLTDAVAYQEELSKIDERVKEMVRKDGGAVLAATSWAVNGSEAQGRTMVRDFSKLMLRAFNAEADHLVRGLKPHKLDAAIERLTKVSDVIERLGKTMQIRISAPYFNLRVQELELTADFLQKEAEEKGAERAERERLREERKAQQEIERERARLEKERQHYENAFSALVEKGDQAGASRIRDQLCDVQKAIEDVDYRAANMRAGYVYVVSNIGSFGDDVIKVGMTRRLDPMERIRELSDASVPFNFDVHALFFSKDAVGIETEMHARLVHRRVNQVNQRREFFRVTPVEAKAHLAELAGELLQFHDTPEALEYRESLARVKTPLQDSIAPPKVASITA